MFSPYAIENHCSPHCMNLVINHVCQEIEYINSEYEVTLKEAHDLISNSLYL